MLSPVKNIFEIEELGKIQLVEHEEVLRKIMSSYQVEIELISKMEDKNLEESLIELLNGEKDAPEYEFYRSNLLYIKQSYFIDKKEREVGGLDLEMIRNIKLEEIIDYNAIKENTDLKISVDTIKEIVQKKNEDNEKWKDYNVSNTVSKLLGLPESNISFISTLSEYIAFVSKLSAAANYVSRGQRDCTYELAPSLHRKYKKDYEIHSNEYESAFKQKIVYYDKEIKKTSSEEIKAEGQHFGLPTEYLDFTEAHLISLLFAIEDYKYTHQHSIVYFIDSVAYNAETVDQRVKLIDYSHKSVIEQMRKYSSRSYFIKLGNINERIHFQKGCFLKVSSQDKEELRRKLVDHCKVVIINKESKKEILKELFNLGITFENIYPDKDNVVKSIRFHYEELQGGNRL